MKLRELIELADKGYKFGLSNENDDSLLEYLNEEGDGLADVLPGEGSMLAYFIVEEIAVSFEKNASNKDQMAEARRVIGKASDDLVNIVRALWDDPKWKERTK